MDYRSYITYECEYAQKNSLRVVALYNSRTVDRIKCPKAVRYMGTHIAAKTGLTAATAKWDIEAIQKSIAGI